mgnify:CR=1 FL=1
MKSSSAGKQDLDGLRSEAQYPMLDVPLDRFWNHVLDGRQAVHERRQRRILTKGSQLALTRCGRRDLLPKQLRCPLALSDRLRRLIACSGGLFLERHDLGTSPLLECWRAMHRRRS